MITWTCTQWSSPQCQVRGLHFINWPSESELQKWEKPAIISSISSREAEWGKLVAIVERSKDIYSWTKRGRCNCFYDTLQNLNTRWKKTHTKRLGYFSLGEEGHFPFTSSTYTSETAARSETRQAGSLHGLIRDQFASVEIRKGCMSGAEWSNKESTIF